MIKHLHASGGQKKISCCHYIYVYRQQEWQQVYRIYYWNVIFLIVFIHQYQNNWLR